MIYYFQFGYHGPEDWTAVRDDPDFDCESTGVLAIQATTKQQAYAWGIEVAKWYTASIHARESAYTWSEQQYAAWAEQEVPEDENLESVPLIMVGQHPDLEQMRTFLGN